MKLFSSQISDVRWASRRRTIHTIQPPKTTMKRLKIMKEGLCDTKNIVPPRWSLLCWISQDEFHLAGTSSWGSMLWNSLQEIQEEKSTCKMDKKVSVLTKEYFIINYDNYSSKGCGNCYIIPDSSFWRNVSFFITPRHMRNCSRKQRELTYIPRWSYVINGCDDKEFGCLLTLTFPLSRESFLWLDVRLYVEATWEGSTAF